MEHLKTISDLMHKIDFQIHVFDMGRRLIQIDKSIFRSFESGELPYPYPLQRHAWLGLLCRDKQRGHDHFIWFLRLPLDELGCLSTQVMHDLITYLVTSVLSYRESTTGAEALPNSHIPYGFTPGQEKLACFHAHAAMISGKPPSKHYAHAVDYISGKIGYEQWPFIALQGLADLAARFSEQGNEALIAKAISRLPPEPLMVLCKCLENEPIGLTIAKPLAQRIRDIRSMKQPDIQQLTAYMRGISATTAVDLKREILSEILSDPCSSDIEILVAISGRCWEELKDNRIRHLFIAALAGNSTGQDAFNHTIADLLFIPDMREIILTELRNPQRSKSLAQAMDKMFKSFTDGA